MGKFLDNLLANNHLPLTTHPTRLANRTATLLDFISTNNINREFCTGIITTALSDHFPVFFSFKIKQSKGKITKKMVREFSESNIDNFNTKIGELDWDHLFGIKFCQTAFTTINNKINETFEQCFPTIEKIYNKACSPLNPWMSKGLLTSRQKKEKLFTKKCKIPTYSNIDCYKNYAKMYQSLCKQAKILHYNNKFKAAGSNMKECWSIIREVIGSPKKCQNLPGYFKNGVKKLRSDIDIVKGFNEFFSSIGYKLDNELKEGKSCYKEYLRGNIKSRFKFREVTMVDIHTIISKMKPKPNSGPELISAKLLKACSAQLCPILVHLINLSLKQGIFPYQLKVAKVIPVYKSEDSHIFGNYRPISLLPAFSMVFEKCVAKQLTDYLNLNDLYYDLQFGFRKGHSTIHPLVKFLNYISESHKINNHALAIFIDLKKAFDTVNHQILLDKLKYYGIRGIANSWFRDYLYNRQQFVYINGTR